MKLSPLQEARYKYEPKLPEILTGDVASIKVQLGEPTESVADQKDLAKLFSNTYGKPIANLAAGSNPDAKKSN